MLTGNIYLEYHHTSEHCNVSQSNIGHWRSLSVILQAIATIFLTNITAEAVELSTFYLLNLRCNKCLYFLCVGKNLG